MAEEAQPRPVGVAAQARDEVRPALDRREQLALEAGVLKPSESKAQIDGGLVKPIAVFANERIKAVFQQPMIMTPEQLGALTKKSTEDWAVVIKAANLKVE